MILIVRRSSEFLFIPTQNFCFYFIWNIKIFELLRIVARVRFKFFKTILSSPHSGGALICAAAAAALQVLKWFVH
jgi:hypothetical protein